MSARRVLTRTVREVHLAEDVAFVHGGDPWTRCTGTTLCERDAWEISVGDEGPAICRRCQRRAEWSLAFDLCRIVGREDYDEVENRVRALVADLIAEKAPR